MSVEVKIGIAQLVVLVITLVYILVTLRHTKKQTDYLRKYVFGELYDYAQIKDLQFYLPEKEKHVVEGFEQKEDKDTIIGNSITVPASYERELHIRWKMAESQTLRSFTIGFDGEFKSKPKIIDRITAFVKRELSLLPREEYIDYHGNYHCEYGHARRLPKDETFVTSLKVKGEQGGKYVLSVEIFVFEAPHPYKGQLEVKCE